MTSDVFFGIEHRMNGEEGQQFNELAKSNLKIAVDEARDTEECTEQEDKKHTSGGSSSLLMEPCRPWSAKTQEQCEGFQAMNEVLYKHGSILKEDCRCLRSTFGNSEGWSQRNEALFEAVINETRCTLYQRLVACDANMVPDAFS